MRLNSRHPNASAHDTFLQSGSRETRRHNPMAPRLFAHARSDGSIGFAPEYTNDTPPAPVAQSGMHYAFVFGEVKLVPRGTQVTSQSTGHISHEEAMRRKEEHLEKIRAWNRQTMGDEMFNKNMANVYGPGGVAFQQGNDRSTRAAVRERRKWVRAAQATNTTRPQRNQRPQPRTQAPVASAASVNATSAADAETAPLPRASTTASSKPSARTQNSETDGPREMADNGNTASGFVLRLTGLNSTMPKIQSFKRVGDKLEAIKSKNHKRPATSEASPEDQPVPKKRRVAFQESSSQQTSQQYRSSRFTRVSKYKTQYSDLKKPAAIAQSVPDIVHVGKKSNKRKLVESMDNEDTSAQPTKRRRAAATAANTRISNTLVHSKSAALERTASDPSAKYKKPTLGTVS